MENKKRLIFVICFLFASLLLCFGLSFNLTAKASEPQVVSFSKVNTNYNNVSSKTGYRDVVLVFGGSINGGSVDTTNYASTDSLTSQNIKINGISIYDIYTHYKETKVDYSMASNSLFIRYPEVLLLKNDNSRVTTLHIENGTPFIDKALGEVNLSLVAGNWVSGKIEEMGETENYSTLSDCGLKAVKHTFVNGASLPIAAGLNGFSYRFRAIFNLGENRKNDALLHFEVYGYSIDLKSSSLVLNNSTGKPISKFDGLNIKNNTDFTLELDFNLDESGEIAIGIDHAKLIGYQTKEINDIGGLDNIWVVVTGESNVTVSDYKDRGYYSSELQYSGEDCYVFNEGDPEYDFKSLFNAFNLYNSEISNENLVFEYQDGAISEGKYNNGIWELKVKLVTEELNLKVQKTIKIVVQGDDYFYAVTFDGQNKIYVQEGNKIETAIENPQNYCDEDNDYIFDCWTYNGTRWDFENDIVNADMNLISKFVSTERHYNVNVTYSGLNKPNESYRVSKNVVISKDSFIEDETTVSMSVNGKKVENVTVDKDIEIKVTYKIEFTHHEAVKSTCVTKGQVEYWTSKYYEGIFFGDSLGKTTLADISTPTSAHVFENAEYIWEETEDGYSCTGVATCKYCGETIRETVEAKCTVIKEPTETEDGKYKYKVNFSNAYFGYQTKEVVVPKGTKKDEGNTDKEKKAGCFGGIDTVGILVPFALLGAISVIALKKRKEDK